MVPLVAYGAYREGAQAGLWTALVTVAHAAWTLSELGVPFRYGADGLLRLAVVAVVAAVSVLLMADRLGRRPEAAVPAARPGAGGPAGSALSEGAFERLFRHNPQPTWVYDLETLRFLAVNRAAVGKHGYAEHEFLTMRITDIRPGEDVPRLLEELGRPRPDLQLLNEPPPAPR